MSATVTFSARQRAAGAPITVSQREIIDDIATYDANINAGIGVKVGATPPTNTSEFAQVWHIDDTGLDAGEWNLCTYRDGTKVAQQYRTQLRGSLPIGGEVVAGRYLFGFIVGPAGALQAVSSGYLIT